MLKRLTLPGCWYPDALTSGEWCACRHDSTRLETWLGPMDPPDRLLFPRLSEAGMMIAGIAHSTDIAYEWDGGPWIAKGKACGPNGLIYDSLGRLHLSDCGAGVGSQGWRYLASDGRLVTGDQTYGPTDGIELHEWTDLGGGYRVGQGPSDNGAFLFNPATRRYHEVITGKARFIRARRKGDAVSIACWVEGQGKAEIVWATLDELLALPSVASPRIEKPEPPPVPTPDPPKPEEPNVPELPDVSGLMAVLEAERDRYDAKMTADQCVELMNRTAFLVGGGWGLMRKSGSGGENHGLRSDGVPCSVDALIHLPSGVEGDFLKDAGHKPSNTMGVARPQTPSLHPTDASKWVAPIGASVPTPEPPTTTPPTTPEPQPPVDLQPVLVAIGQLAGRLAEVEQALRIAVQKLDNLENTAPAYAGTVRLFGVTGSINLEPKQ